jgi:hypothetical protein
MRAFCCWILFIKKKTVADLRSLSTTSYLRYINAWRRNCFCCLGGAYVPAAPAAIIVTFLPFWFALLDKINGIIISAIK